MTHTPAANARFAALDDQHRRFDGPLPRASRFADGWQSASRRDGERRMAACRRAIARRREAVACCNPSIDPSIDPVLARLTDRLTRLRAARIDARIDARGID